MRTVIASGGSSGIGQATAARFARGGERVADFLTGQEFVVDGGETAGATTAIFGTGGVAAR
ncbi:MAG TPA: hypothetical protein VFG87_10805 [Amycolatopsis sp.]|jgi:NAD(P)-dependent dehydrogenase (short-subunit alcohol dehydrogenase family)|nr:hypothetical protein [Amycolatopsis sp.]